MARSTQHELQPGADHDGITRRLTVLACKSAIRKQLQIKLHDDFESEALADRGDDPVSAREVASQIESLDSYQIWSAANKASQDRMWQVLSEQIDEEYERIATAASAATESAQGSLALGELDTIPGYQTQAAIHGQPGGYMLQREDDDIAAGILYEAGGNIYALGQGIGNRDSKGERLIAHIRERFPDCRPTRVLEMGCSAGGQSTDYPEAFPDAEFHAIDLSPGMLRYAHARAELLGRKVHFHQQDAASTQFPDGHFDLIISHNLFHEVAAQHMTRILTECHRLLSSDGVCIHQDVPIQTHRYDAFGQFISEWQKDHNDEPFWLDFANADLPAMLVQVGFAASSVTAEYLQAIDGPIPWYVVAAIK